MATVEEQIVYAAARFGKTVAAEFPKQQRERIELLAISALISGASLASHFIVANEGHPDVTAQAVERAAEAAAVRFGLRKETLLPKTPPTIPEAP